MNRGAAVPPEPKGSDPSRTVAKNLQFAAQWFPVDAVTLTLGGFFFAQLEFHRGPIVSHGRMKQRADCRPLGSGLGVITADLDEDLGRARK